MVVRSAPRRHAGQLFSRRLRELTLPPEAVSRLSQNGRSAAVVRTAGEGPRSNRRDRLRPGGASQALLARGLKVIGIDPAKVDPIVLANPHFTHIQKRGTDVRRREFAHVDWLAVDVNVAPQFTLDMLEAIVTHPAVNIRGLLLTLKLLEWSLAESVPDYLDRIRGWGYAHVRARQLPHNRQEICVTASGASRPRKRGGNEGEPNGTQWVSVASRPRDTWKRPHKPIALPNRGPTQNQLCDS